MGRTLLSIAAAISIASSLGAQEKPLPAQRPFFDATRQNLERSQGRQSGYAYRERRGELHTNPFGRLGSGRGTEEYEVTPLAGGGIARTLVARDGRPVKGETITSRPRARTSKKSPVTDTIEALDLAIDRRERLDGRDVIVITLSPKAGARPETREGKLAHNFRGEIFVDEASAEVVRVEATAVDDLSYGLGVVARVNKGATVTLVREPVDGDTWFPTSVRFSGSGRALLFRKLRIDHVVEWLNYRRATAATLD